MHHVRNRCCTGAVGDPDGCLQTSLLGWGDYRDRAAHQCRVCVLFYFRPVLFPFVNVIAIKLRAPSLCLVVLFSDCYNTWEGVPRDFEDLVTSDLAGSDE